MKNCLEFAAGVTLVLNEFAGHGPRLEPAAQRLLVAARDLALSLGSSQIEPEHILHVALAERLPEMRTAAEDENRIALIERAVQERLARCPQPTNIDREIALSSRTTGALQIALREAKAESGAGLISSARLIRQTLRVADI